MSNKTKGVLVNLNKDVCSEVDNLLGYTGLSRTNFIRQSIIRNIEFTKKYELKYYKQKQKHFDEICSGHFYV